MKNLTKEKIFVYGTLSDPEVQKHVFGRVVSSVICVLDGYKRSKILIDGDIYPIIIPRKKGKVLGSIIEVTTSELKKIDKYETSAYRRKKVVLKNNLVAWVYVKR